MPDNTISIHIDINSLPINDFITYDNFQPPHPSNLLAWSSLQRGQAQDIPSSSAKPNTLEVIAPEGPVSTPPIPSATAPVRGAPSPGGATSGTSVMGKSGGGTASPPSLPRLCEASPLAAPGTVLSVMTASTAVLSPRGGLAVGAERVGAMQAMWYDRGQKSHMHNGEKVASS